MPSITPGGMPMSPTTTSPQNSRPASSRCPGLGRTNVTVASARRTSPNGAPVAPSSPLGTSTAITRRAARSSATAAGGSGRSAPAPNTASITSGRTRRLVGRERH